MKLRLYATCAVIAFASPAWADAVSDATAGAQALSQGNTKEAHRLFTQAIQSGQLSQDDLESAYVLRGQSYLQGGSPDHARRDADAALRLKPGDPDAVALWKNTTEQVAPQEQSPRDATTTAYVCLPLNKPDSKARLTFEINYGKAWVRTERFGESGRKLSIDVADATVKWRMHEETDNGGTADQDVMFNNTSNVLTNSFTNSGGAIGTVQWTCQVNG